MATPLAWGARRAEITLSRESHGAHPLRITHLPCLLSFGAVPPAAHPPRGGRARAAADADDAPPPLLGDWREARAKLVADGLSGGPAAWAAARCPRNAALLAQQDPGLAAEEVFAHELGLPERGGLLLATPEAPALIGDRYWQAVLLVVEHDPARGSVLLLLNRPTRLVMGKGLGGLPLGDASPAVREAFAGERLYCGGFVAQDRVRVLHRWRHLPGAAEVAPGVFLGGQDAAALEAAAAPGGGDGALPASSFKFFAGCVAMGPGQLEAQVREGVWWPAAASRSLALKQCLALPTPLWREVLNLMGGRFAAAAEAARREQAERDADEQQAP